MGRLKMNKLKVLLNQNIPSGGLLKNAVTLISGTGFAQVLLLVISPILTRLYTPEAFGTYTIYISILAVVGVISCLRYELAIVLPARDKNAANVLVISIFICIFLSIISLFIIAFFNKPLASFYDIQGLQLWLWLLPLGILTTGIFQALNYWNTRKRQFRRLAVRQVTQSTVVAATQLTSGMTLPVQSGGLIIGHIAGQITATGRLLWQTWKDEGKQIISYISIKRILINIVKYKNFPIYSSWSGLLNTASVMMPPLLIGYFFSPTTVGLYSLGHRVLNLPMSLIGNAVAQAFYPHATEAKQKGNLNFVTLGIFKTLISIGLVPILLLTLIAPELFELIFGQDWYEAGEYVRYISPWLFLVFISSPLSNLYLILEKQRLGLIIDLLLFSSRLLVLILGGFYGSALITIALFGIVGAILWIINCITILKLAGIPFYIVFKEIIRGILNAVPYTLFSIIVLVWLDIPEILVLSGLLSGIIFLFVQIKKNKNVLKNRSL